MSPPNTSHEAGEAEEAGGAYDVDETTRLLLGLPSLVVTVGGATSTATSCCSSACNSPKTDRYYSNDDDRGRDRDRASQFLPSLLRPQSQPHPTSSSLQLPSHSPSPYPRDHHQHHHHHLSPRSAASPFPIVASSVRSVFSDIHSECELSKQEIHNESEFYLRSSIVARGT